MHAYVLMTNHVHLLVTPTASGQVAQVMQSLGRRYVRYVNDRYHRTGTLWEGRYKSSPVASDDHLLRCYRYPVGAAMVDDPARHDASSYSANALGRHDPLLTAHPHYLAFGHDGPMRQVAYGAFVREAVSDEEITVIRSGCNDSTRLAMRASVGSSKSS